MSFYLDFWLDTAFLSVRIASKETGLPQINPQQHKFRITRVLFYVSRL
jgi:hypothetical protein